MIYIQKSPSADSRTAKGEVTKEELYRSSVMHIHDVQKGLQFFADLLVKAGQKHDHTKLEYIDEFYHDFSQKLKGKEFKDAHWYKDLHLQERHHLPDRCPDDVTLIDVLERIADICMAGMARSGEVYDDDLDPEILTKAFHNTIQLLISNIQVVDDDNTTDRVQNFTSQLK